MEGKHYMYMLNSEKGGGSKTAPGSLAESPANPDGPPRIPCCIVIMYTQLNAVLSIAFDLQSYEASPRDCLDRRDLQSYEKLV